MDITDKLNMTMLCDFYELTMGNGYLEAGLKDRITYFDIFFRDVPDHGGYAICAGLERIIAYIQDLHFSEEDIEYLRSKDLFSERFLDYLRDFKFTGDVWAIPEGTPIFPREPIITVRAPAIQAQLVETFLLLIFNHQSLVATKTNRIVRAAEGRVILEFGSRRAQGTDAAISGARAAYIGGCAGTACTISDQLFGVPAGGTMAHAWVQMFDSEYEAFKTYCEVFPTNATLLVDTYNTLKSGVPNAIKAFNEVLRPKGITKCAIRLDSGDLAYLTKKARKMLDDAGFEDAIISASSDLDEYLIDSLKTQGAAITSWGVGTNLITSKDNPAFGGVYKLAAVMGDDGTFIPKIKLSENSEKITNPGNKTVYRVYDADGMIKADLITLADETYDESQPLLLFDPVETWKKTLMEPGEYSMREIMVKVFDKGECVYDSPNVMDIQKYCKQEQATLWDESKRLINPQVVHVDLSQKLYDLKQELLHNYGREKL